MTGYGPPDDPSEAPTGYIDYGQEPAKPRSPWYRRPLVLVALGLFAAILIGLALYVVTDQTHGSGGSTPTSTSPTTSTAATTTATTTPSTTTTVPVAPAPTTTLTEPPTTTEPTTTTTPTTTTAPTTSTSIDEGHHHHHRHDGGIP